MQPPYSTLSSWFYRISGPTLGKWLYSSISDLYNGDNSIHFICLLPGFYELVNVKNGAQGLRCKNIPVDDIRAAPRAEASGVRTAGVFVPRPGEPGFL